MVSRGCLWTLWFAAELLFVLGARTKDKMYVSLSGASCFRRLNGTHQTGCSSESSGSVGALHLIMEEKDFNFLLNGPPAPPYAPIIPPHLFTRKNMLRLKNEASKNISAVLLINQTDKMIHFSHELNCPNPYSGIIQKAENNSNFNNCDMDIPEKSWNPWGTGLLHEDFPFPIYYIFDDKEIQTLLSCFKEFNSFDYETQYERRLCSVEVSTFMSAAVSTEVCMRRTNFINNLSPTKYCDPLEGLNVYATLFTRNFSTDSQEQMQLQNENEKFILIACRLDTTSMFDSVGLGAADSLIGYATLIGVSQMLRNILPDNKLLSDKTRNVLFVVFNGESYDYIGSQRLIYDMENSLFPPKSSKTPIISLDNIEFMLDIGILDDIDKIKLHTFNSFPKATEILQKLKKYAENIEFDFKINIEHVIGSNMPPTSAQSFLRKNSSFPALVINSLPTNRYYHSIYDGVENINFNYENTSLNFSPLMPFMEAFKYFRSDSVQMKVRNISSVIAMAVYEELTRLEYLEDSIVNPLLIDEFLYCFLKSADCPLFKAASKPNNFPGIPLPPIRYISVKDGPQESSGWTYRVLGYILSTKVENYTVDNCTEKPLSWVAGFDGKGECRKTTQDYSHALSPAFMIPDYAWSSGEYSTWTESTWSQLSARVFLRPSKQHQVVTLSLGLIVLIGSFFFVYIMSSKADILFEDTPTSTAILTEPTAC